MAHGSATASATPAALLALAHGGAARAERLLTAAGRLRVAGLTGPADALARHAHTAAELDRWVAQVGQAFTAADEDGDGRDAPRVLWRDGSGDGRIVEVFGDLATARHIAVVVPGVGTTLANEGATLRTAAREIFDACRALSPDTAVVAWLGYDPPDTFDAPLQGASRIGGRELARFVASLAPRPGATITVVGHSYGSLVAAEALRDGMHVDDVVVTGSPGLGAARARDLPLAGAGLFALRAPLDLVGWSEAFGRDPSDPRFGATRLDTGDGPNQSTGHSSYFEAGSESLANIAAVIAQRDDLLDVVRPSPADRALGGLDDIWRGLNDPPIDRVQAAVAGASTICDLIDSAAPGPLGEVASRERTVRNLAVEEAERLIDEVQRVTSPDFVADVLSDALDLFP